MKNNLDGRAYLKTYYQGLAKHPENIALMSFFTRSSRHLENNARVLDLASGPTIYQVISAARVASTIVLSDISPELLSFCERWRDKQSDAFNWDPYISEVLKLEASQGISSGDDLSSRKAKIRQSLEFAIIDILKPQLVTIPQPFDLVQAVFLGTSCACSHASLLDIWKKSASHVVPGGTLVIIEICDADYYLAGKDKIEAYKIGYEEQVKLLDAVGCQVIDKEFFPADKRTKCGYSGFAMFHLKKPFY